LPDVPIEIERKTLLRLITAENIDEGGITAMIVGVPVEIKKDEYRVGCCLWGLTCW